MIACGSCFVDASWTAAVPEGTPGSCDFGHGYSDRTWSTDLWSDYFLHLIEVYVSADLADAGAAPLAERLQSDWLIFSLDDLAVRNFLGSALPGTSFDASVRVEFDAEGGVTDHLSSWALFVREISVKNRFFPRAKIDHQSILGACSSSETTLRQGTEFHRARRTILGAALPIDEMGAPPHEIARAGRANPVGISYLYAALDDATAIHEARIANQEAASVARFVATRDLHVLNLATVKPPNPFVGDDLKDRLVSAAFLREVASELSTPMRDSDREISYIPTQYFCELIKSAGLDGVMYSSSLYAGGKNIVLFEESATAGDPIVRTAIVSRITADWSYIS